MLATLDESIDAEQLGPWLLHYMEGRIHVLCFRLGQEFQLVIGVDESRVSLSRCIYIKCLKVGVFGPPKIVDPAKGHNKS